MSMKKWNRFSIVSINKALKLISLMHCKENPIAVPSEYSIMHEIVRFIIIYLNN